MSKNEGFKKSVDEKKICDSLGCTKTKIQIVMAALLISVSSGYSQSAIFSEGSSKIGEKHNRIPEHWFVRKTWKSEIGTTFNFEKNGTGRKKYGTEDFPLNWKIMPDGILLITSQSIINGPNKTWYIKLTGRKSGFVGTAIDQVTTVLKPLN